MFTGKQLFKELTTSQRIKFKENRRTHEYTKSSGDWEMYMQSNFRTGTNFIGGAFSWVRTKQGLKYWSDINEQFRKFH